MALEKKSLAGKKVPTQAKKPATTKSKVDIKKPETSKVIAAMRIIP